MNTRPVKGKGDRWFDCKYYDDCLDLAALKNWHSFNCTRCPLYQHVFQKMEINIMEPLKSNPGAQTIALEKKKENTRICEQCHERVTISPSSPLCAHCMAVKSNKARKRPENRFKRPDPTPSIGEDQKTQHRADLSPEKKADNKVTLPEATTHIKKPAQTQHDGAMALTIEFNGYATILDGIKRIAEYELRPLDKQILYILQEYVRSHDAVKTP